MPYFSKKNSSVKPTFIANTRGLDYELLDSGNRRKLERFGEMILDRPEISANWRPESPRLWENTDWYFKEEGGQKGKWVNQSGKAESWNIEFKVKNQKLEFALELTKFKHIGLFPEQAENWHYIAKRLGNVNGEKRVLNLFAYTGAASIVCASCGAIVTNVDSVKQVLNWGRKNAEINQLDGIRWILEDARKYVKKAVRRGEKYHGVILDPPAFGYGAKKERWKLEQDLQPLLEDVFKLIIPKRSFIILNTYTPRMQADELLATLNQVENLPKKFELNTLGLESGGEKRLELGNLFRL